MGPEHVPESIIKGLFTKKESVVESVISEPEEKKRKLETTTNLTLLNENELKKYLKMKYRRNFLKPRYVQPWLFYKRSVY